MTHEVTLLPPPQQAHRVLRFQFWRTVFNWVWHEKWHAGAENAKKGHPTGASRPPSDQTQTLQKAPSASGNVASPDIQRGAAKPKELPEESICQHFHNEPHCVVYAFKGLVRGAVVAWCLKSVFSLAIALFSRKMFFQPVQTIVRILLDRESLVFARFLGAMGCVYRLLQCLLCKMHNGPSKTHSAIAAFLAGSTILLDSPSRRSTVAIYLVVRGIYELARSLAHSGVVHQVPYLTQLIFAVCQIPIMYSAMRSPHALNPSYRRFIYGMGNMDVPAVHLIVGKNQPDFHQCAGMAHEGTCVEYNVRDALHGIFVRAPPIFLPVHVIPALIFKHRFLRSHPLSFLKESMSNVARSCLFLATYTSLVKSGMCFWRNLLGRNADWAFALIGFSTGLSIFWERSSRHAELMVYCVPRAVETALNLFSHKLPSSWQWLYKTGAIDAFLFSCAAALFVYCADSSPGLKPLNRTIFNFVFGTATQIPAPRHSHSQPHSPQTPASAGRLQSPAPKADNPETESKRV